jgi:hypothetical protein
MQRTFQLICALLFAYPWQLVSQADSLKRLTGLYQTTIDPSVEFIIKNTAHDLLLEIPGEGEAKMLPRQPNIFGFNQIPAVVQFNLGAHDQVVGFSWIQKMGRAVEWIKVPGEDQTTVSGHYRLQGNPYKNIYIRAAAGKLTSTVNAGPELPLTDSAGKLRVIAKNYSIWYEFKKDKKGQYTKLITQEGGMLEFVRVKEYDASFGGGFLRPEGFKRADSLRGMLTALRSCYDVRFYNLDVEVFPEKKYIKGQNNIRFRAINSFDSMQIDLYENIKIAKIIWRGREVDFTREYNAVFIRFPETIDAGVEESVTVYFEGKPIQPSVAELKGGFFWLQDRDGDFWIQSVCQGSGASLWWPCKDHLSDEPDSMKISVTIPGDLVVVSNGKLSDTTLLSGNRRRFNWTVGYPINNYNVAVNIGKYVHFSDRYVSKTDSMQLNFYCLAYNREPANKIFSRTKEMLSYLEKMFGEYPFKKDGFTLMESIYPMEHQGAVSIGSINQPFGSKKIPFGELKLTMWHEAAHEWWGNNITAQDIADLWIHEAFATYAEVMLTEFFEGQKASQKLLQTEIPANKEPIIGAYGVNDFRLGDVYSKGCLMLHTLRNVIDNDSTWFGLLRGLQRNFRHQTVTTGDIVRYVNKSLRKDFTAFFEQYLRHPALPELQMRFKQVGDELEIDYRWKTDVRDFNMPVKVTTSKTQSSFIYPEDEWKSMKLQGMTRKTFKVHTSDFLIKVNVDGDFDR